MMKFYGMMVDFIFYQAQIHNFLVQISWLLYPESQSRAGKDHLIMKTNVNRHGNYVKTPFLGLLGYLAKQ